MNFSVNQTRQFYVGKVYSATPKNAGDIKPAKKDGYIYFNYIGADGNPMRSDLIKESNILYTKKTTADKMKHPLKSVIVALDTTINEGKIVANQDYMVKINIRQYLGISDDNTTTKYGIVHGYSGMTKNKFYATLALSLAKNFSREVSPLFDFSLKTATGSVPVKATDKVDTLEGGEDIEYTGVVITEKEQPWTLGIEEQAPVYFDVFVDTIVYNGAELTWGSTTSTSSIEGIKNGKKVADMEYFYMGERGDIYRNAGWPNVIKTQYLVDPSLDYDIYDIHYAYVGPNESVQKSEKDITIAVPTSASSSFMTNLNLVLPEDLRLK